MLEIVPAKQVTVAEADEQPMGLDRYIRKLDEGRTVAHQLVAYGHGENRSVWQMVRVIDVLNLLLFPRKREARADYSWLLLGKERPTE